MTVSGGSGCAPAEAQRLTFSGALNGTIACSLERPACGAFNNSVSTAGVVVPVHGRAGSAPLQLVIALTIAYAGPGAYPIQTEHAGTTVSVDGPGRWQGRVPGTVTVTSDTPAGIVGSVDAVLESAGKTAHLSGAWRCVR